MSCFPSRLFARSVVQSSRLVIPKLGILSNACTWQAGGGVWKPYAVFMAFCLGYSALSGALVSFGAPLAAGSGIPEIKTYLNGVHVRGAALLGMHVPLRGKLH